MAGDGDLDGLGPGTVGALVVKRNIALSAAFQKDVARGKFLGHKRQNGIEETGTPPALDLRTRFRLEILFLTSLAFVCGYDTTHID
jgi:hypothetical protein